MVWFMLLSFIVNWKHLPTNQENSYAKRFTYILNVCKHQSCSRKTIAYLIAFYKAVSFLVPKVHILVTCSLLEGYWWFGVRTS